MMGRIVMMVLLVLCCSFPVAAREVAGVALEEQLTTDNGTVLSLNGAGIRTKFFFKIYVAALYLEKRGDTAEAVIGEEAAKRMVMHFLYDEVGQEDLIEAWNDGFNGNGTSEQLAALAGEIAKFNTLFSAVKAGDQIVLDYHPGTGTAVLIRGEHKGTIPGKPFNDLLLSIWLGKEPVTEDLRAALLGT